MTVTPSPAENLTLFSTDAVGLYRSRRDTFLFSLVGQAIVLALMVYLTCCVLVTEPPVARFPDPRLLPLVFSGHDGGGGGGLDKLPASHGNPPPSSLVQVASPTVMHPSEMPKLPGPMSVEAVPDVKYLPGVQIGDPNSPFTGWLSNGPGRNGIGKGCCGGVGDSTGPYVGNGIHMAGKHGVTVPVPIYSPEPDFSDEARKAKQQGVVGLLLVVGADGHAHDIRVRQSLGMGLDQKAEEAVSRWRFKPATLNGQPVATQIVVEVEFHLY